jgi:hypothetical protein
MPEFTWLAPVACEVCGSEVIRSASLAGRKHVYCCTAHGALGPRLRGEAKRDEQRRLKLAARRQRMCGCGCEEWFTPTRSTQKYRSDAHRLRAHRRWHGHKFEWLVNPDGSSVIAEVDDGRIVRLLEHFTAGERDVKRQVDGIYADLARLGPTRALRSEIGEDDGYLTLLQAVFTAAPPRVACSLADKLGLPALAERFGLPQRGDGRVAVAA